MYELNRLEEILKKRQQTLSESMIVRRGNYVYEDPRHSDYAIRCQELSVVLSAINDLKELNNN